MEFFLSPVFSLYLVTSLCPLTLLMLSDNHPYFGLSGTCCQSALESIHGLGSNMVWVLCGCIQPVAQRSSTVYHVPEKKWSTWGPFSAHILILSPPEGTKQLRKKGSPGSHFQTLPSFRKRWTREHWKTLEVL